MLKMNGGRKILVILCESCGSQHTSSRNSERVQINIRGAGYQRAEGENAYVHMSGLRLMSHELVHATKRHRVSTFSEMQAVQKSNIIMRQHYIRSGYQGSAGIQNHYGYGLQRLPSGGVSLESNRGEY